MRRFFVLFPLLLVLMFGFELLPWGQNYLVRPWTDFIAELSAKAMHVLDDRVLSQGNVIWDRESGFGVAIEAGCNGVEAAIVLIAAMLAFPASWRARLVGTVLGILTVQILNLVRIVTLFYLGQWDRTLFEWAHLYVWQALIMLDVMLVFLFWLRWISARTGADPRSS